MSAHLRAPAHPTSARTATALHAHARHSLALGLHSTLHSPPFVSFPGRSQCELSNEVRSAFGRAEFPFENRLNVPKIAHFFRCAKLKTTCSKNHLAHVQGTPDCGFSRQSGPHALVSASSAALRSTRRASAAFKRGALQGASLTLALSPLFALFRTFRSLIPPLPPLSPLFSRGRRP